jgi:hypothetical protein
MNLPHFTAASTLYRSRRHYSASLAYGDSSLSGHTVVASYRPGPETMRECYHCTEETCAKQLATCEFLADLSCLFPPACAPAHAACYLKYGECLAQCVAPIIGDCCPKVCSVPNPFDPGSGCCDEGEGCVSEGDPNARKGCCPSGRSVCGGKCCDAGDQCCGDLCCPEGHACCGGTCCEAGTHCCGDTCCLANIPCCGGTCCSLLPPVGTPPPPPPPHSCGPGGVPCGFPDATGVIRTCCPPGLQCCNYSAEFGPDCKTMCLH